MRSYQTKKPFEGVITNLERRFKETESDWAREELQKYFTDIPCDACNGFRLKPEALCVKIARPAHRRHLRDVDQARRRVVHRAAGAPHQEADRDRRPRAEGNPRAAQVPGRRRPRISHAGARLRHAVGRREPAHSPGLADRLGPHRRALRARRALHRPAPARQRAASGHAAAPARPRQHRDRGRARRGRDPHRRPRARHRPRRRHPRRRDHRPGPGRRPDRRLEIDHRQISLRRAGGADPRAPRQAAPRAQGRQRARQQPEEPHHRDPARRHAPASPASPAAASPPC